MKKNLLSNPLCPITVGKVSRGDKWDDNGTTKRGTRSYSPCRLTGPPPQSEVSLLDVKTLGPTGRTTRVPTVKRQSREEGVIYVDPS